jgi:peptidoglycan/LPS O-acetylase OafA/YrhL
MFLGIFLVLTNTLIPYHDPHSLYSRWAGPVTNFLVITFNRNLFSLGIMLVMFASLFPRGLSQWCERLLSLPNFIIFANTSYSIYLFHLPLLVVAAYITYAAGIPLDEVKNLDLRHYLNHYKQWQLALNGFLLSTLVASLVYIFLEKPLIKLGHQLTSRTPKPKPLPRVHY